MDGRTFLVVFITLAVAGVFLAIWMRRDARHEPKDELAEAMGDALDRKRARGLGISADQ